MTQQQMEWLEKVRVITADAIQGKIPTYEDAVNDIQNALDTCHEP